MDNDITKMISGFINRLCDCSGLNTVLMYGDELPLDIYPCITVIQQISSFEKQFDALALLAGDNAIDGLDNEALNDLLDCKICIFLCNRIPVFLKHNEYIAMRISDGEYRNVVLRGELFVPKRKKVPDDFKVLAILHIYNEADIIERTLDYLISQDIEMYVFDNWSNDGTYEIVQRMCQENSKILCLERFPTEGATSDYNWYSQLQKTENIARKCEYDWYIHYDTDEMRISPWEGINLRETIYIIDQMGYNLIENTVIDFKITDLQRTDIFMQDVWFDFGRKKTHFEQTKTWKKSENVELAKSGGHLAIVDAPKVFPLKILNRHYPFRNIEQAKKKVFKDRLPRFQKERREHGWHGQYDDIINERDVISDKHSLIKWDETVIEHLWIPLFTGAGIARTYEDNWKLYLNKKELGITESCRYVLFGAGTYGRVIYCNLFKSANVVAWVDTHYLKIGRQFGVIIQNPAMLSEIQFDMVIIAVDSEKAMNEICEYLASVGVSKDMIIWRKWSEHVNG